MAVSSAHKASLEIHGLSRWGQFIFVIIGFGLCVGTPIISVGPSFIVWPTVSEVAFLLLLFVGLPYIRKTAVPQPVFASGLFFYGYTILAALVIALSMDYPLEYPSWVIFRFGQWIVAIIVICHALPNATLRPIMQGLLAGLIVNIFSVYIQIAGGSVAAILMTFVDPSGAGPWGLVKDYKTDFLSIEERGAAGVFSYSRTATGFLFAILAGSIFTEKLNVWRLVLLVLTATAIIGTGSRLGALSFIVVVLSSITMNRRRGGVILLVPIAAFLLFITAAILQLNVDNPFLARLIGSGQLGQETFEEGFQGREDRHSLIWELSILQLIFGAGAGLLGFALQLNLEGFAFYGAHGFIYQYLSSLGIFGSGLALLFVIQCFKHFKISSTMYGILIALAMCGITDDVMFPTAQGAHLPLIVALVYRACSMRNAGKSISTSYSA